MPNAVIKATPDDTEKPPMQRTLDAAYMQVLNGFGFFPSAAQIAVEYSEKNGGDAHRAAKDLIRWQMTKAATSGFLTNLGGVATLPIAIPANISSVLYVQVRMIAAIAILGGYDVHSDKVRTLIYASLLGSAATDVLKDAGIRLGERLTRTAIERITASVAKNMASSAAARLMAKMGLRSAGNLTRLVPIAGGIVAASIDAAATRTVGAVATRLFLPEEHALESGA